jgi:hypothetical protein
MKHPVSEDNHLMILSENDENWIALAVLTESNIVAALHKQADHWLPLHFQAFTKEKTPFLVEGFLIVSRRECVINSSLSLLLSNW